MVRRMSDTTRHPRGQSIERPFACAKCGKTFTMAVNLKTHENIHTGTRPFVCDIEDCTAAFTDRGSLARHKKEKHAQRTYHCPITGCTVQAKRRAQFTIHLRQAHKLGDSDIDINACAVQLPLPESTTPKKRSGRGRKPMATVTPLMLKPQRSTMERSDVSCGASSSSNSSVDSRHTTPQVTESSRQSSSEDEVEEIESPRAAKRPRLSWSPETDEDTAKMHCAPVKQEFILPKRIIYDDYDTLPPESEDEGPEPEPTEVKVKPWKDAPSHYIFGPTITGAFAWRPPPRA